MLTISAHSANNPENYQAKPYLYTYRDPFTKLRNVIQELRDTYPYLQEKEVLLTYRDSGALPDNCTMQDIKKELGRDNINGLTLFTTLLNK